MTTKSMLAVALLILISAGSGCTTFTKGKGAKKDSPFEAMKWWKKEYQTPTKMAVLWSPDLLTVAGQPPTRGFGGRIYFYNEKSQTIPVEGELVVHGFDETFKKATAGQESLPDKRFRFTAEQFTEHFSESDLGASYSVWIPWDSNEHTLKELTLIPTFVSSKGQAVQGAPAKVVLPGRIGTQPAPTTPVQTVAFEQSTIPTVEGKLPTLNLPVRDADKLRGLANGTNGTANGNSNTQSGDMRVTTIKLPSPLGQATRGRDANAGNNVQATTHQANAQSPIQPYVNAQIEQLRAQAVADAFRPLDQPAPPAPQGQPGIHAPQALQGLQGMQGIPGISRQQSMPNTQGMQAQSLQAQGMQGQGMQGAQYQQPANGFPLNPSAPPASHAPRAFKTMPNSLNSNAPYRGDDYPGELPPGFQFSPQGTAW